MKSLLSKYYFETIFENLCKEITVSRLTLGLGSSPKDKNSRAINYSHNSIPNKNDMLLSN